MDASASILNKYRNKCRIIREAFKQVIKGAPLRNPGLIVCLIRYFIYGQQADLISGDVLGQVTIFCAILRHTIKCELLFLNENRHFAKRERRLLLPQQRETKGGYHGR